MEILLWLVPPAVVTGLAMAGAAWWGREGRGEVDRETGVRRLGQALEQDGPRRRYAAPPPPEDRSTGIAVRRSRRAS